MTTTTRKGPWLLVNGPADGPLIHKKSVTPNTMTEIHTGDCLEVLKRLPEASVQTCVTSPPYWGLRDYGHPDQIGREESPEAFTIKLVSVFREVWRVLNPDGTLWLNLGDSYALQGGDHSKYGSNQSGVGAKKCHANGGGDKGARKSPSGLKPKDLVGIPWRVAFALQADGWYLRSEITWCKKAPMPESTTDRPTSATEKIFLLSKSESYFYDADAVRNAPSEAMLAQVAQGYNGSASRLFEENGVQDASDVKSRIIANARKRIDKQRGHSRRHAGFNDRWDHMTKEDQMACGSNMRNYWVVGPEPCAEAHFATFPSEIPRKCILAGSRPGDTILDPFGGSGTTGMVATELGRKSILIELSPDYVSLIEKRTNVTQGFAF